MTLEITDYQVSQVNKIYRIPAGAVNTDLDHQFADDFIRTNTQWRIRNIYFYLDTDANAANRTLVITMEDEYGRVLWRSTHATVVTANQFFYCNMFPASHYKDWDNVSDTCLLPLPDIFIKRDYRFTITVANLQATDQISEVTIVYDAYEGVKRYPDEKELRR